ncbi:hypothetical protein HK097_009196 [Rhizophlyctis rosea]|uniref:Uncharacterized protein n=1 Tax=Rhizophlyctis rosea TaxID=64517 RepID=A0AAD5SBZ4_9FUNG|nr:hypothetical protein HK097_009196 [Rhizophlyctis rosea]
MSAIGTVKTSPSPRPAGSPSPDASQASTPPSLANGVHPLTNPMSENSSVGVAEQPNGLSALENHLANTKRSRSPIALTTSAKRALTGSPGLTPPDTSNKRAKVSPSGDTTPSPADAEIRTLKTELLAAKNATLKAKLDNEQSKSKVVEKDRALVALREEYQHFKAEATATLEKYQREGRGVSEGTDSQLRLQLEQAQARNAALEARIQELEVKIKADRAQWENERQQMAEMVELLEQIEQAAKGGREPEAESREKLGQLAVASTNAVRKTPEVGRTERAPTQGLSNADLGIGIEAEEEDDDPNLNAVIPVDEEALRMVEEQKRREAELRVEVPEDALAELKKEPGLVEDFPVSLSNHRPVLTNPNPVERREAMMLHRNMHPMQNPGPSVMDDIRRMSVPPGANMFARTPLGMSPMRPPGPSMMGPPMGTPMMGPRPPFPMQQKMESPMPMEPPFPVQRPFSQTPFPQTPIDPMAAYFAMMAAAFPGMARPMVIPPGGPTPSMDGGPQMMNGQLPVPARPASMQPVDPLAANVKTEPGTEPVEPPAAPPVTETLPPSVPEGTPVVDDKEVTIYKIKAALYVKESRARAERKACEQGTIAVKAILTKMGSGRLVMYDDWTDDKVMNVSLTGHVTTKTEFRDVFVTVQVDGETIVYIINVRTKMSDTP